MHYTKTFKGTYFDINDALKELRRINNKDEIVINVADKNLGFVINNTSWYVHELNRQLSDSNTYIKMERHHLILLCSVEKVWLMSTKATNPIPQPPTLSLGIG